MKAFKEKQKFTPVTLVIETQEELDILIRVFSWDIRIPNLVGDKEDKESKFSVDKLSKFFTNASRVLCHAEEKDGN